MSSYLKRRVALILAVAIISAQLSACKKLNEVPVQNEAPVATVQQENTEEPTEATEPEVGGLEWLQENLENLKQSLLDGDYAKVVDQLLEMRDELKDNARYNALLYIAYSGKGDKDKANDLLNNKNLNRNEFMDAFLEFTNALKGNAGAKSAEQQLMDAMMHLAQKDKTAYNAAVRVGQNIQNENPSDPNAYVVMYIAALAGNDKAAMKDVLSQAKANGISAEVLSTATVEYIERVNVTDVTTEDAKKGIESSTSFNGKGETLGTEVTVKTTTGAEKTVTAANGSVSDKIEYDKHGNVVSATHVDIVTNTTIDESGLPHVNLVEKGKTVTAYEGGKLKSMQVYGTNGALQTEYTLNPKTGEVLEAKVYTDGENGRDMTDEEMKSVNFEMKDGRMTSQTLPIYENGQMVGKRTWELDYFNRYGMPVTSKQYDLDGNLVFESSRTIDYDKNKNGLVTGLESKSYKNGAQEISTKIDNLDRTVITDMASNNCRYYSKLNADNKVIESSEYALNGSEEILRWFAKYEYEDGVKVSDTTTMYNEDGKVSLIQKKAKLEGSDGLRVTDEFAFTYKDGKESKTHNTFEYDASFNTVKKDVYNVGTDGKEALSQHWDFEYDEAGKPTKDTASVYYDDGVTLGGTIVNTYQNGKLVSKEVQSFDRNSHELINKRTTQYSDGQQLGYLEYEYENSQVVKVSICKGNELTETTNNEYYGQTEYKYILDGEKKIRVYVFESRYNSQKDAFEETDTYYNLDGTIKQIQDFIYDSSMNPVLVKDVAYTYENGVRIEKVTTTYKDGKLDEVTTETSDGKTVTGTTADGVKYEQTYTKTAYGYVLESEVQNSYDKKLKRDVQKKLYFNKDQTVNHAEMYLLNGQNEYVKVYDEVNTYQNGKKAGTVIKNFDEKTGKQTFESTRTYANGTLVKQENVEYVDGNPSVYTTIEGDSKKVHYLREDNVEVMENYTITENGEVLDSSFQMKFDEKSGSYVEQDIYYNTDGTTKTVENYVYDNDFVPELVGKSDYVYDANGTILSREDTAFNDGQEVKKTINDYKNGAIYKITESTGDKKTVRELDDHGNMTEEQYTITDSGDVLNHRFYQSYDSETGVLTERDTYYNADGTENRVEDFVYDDNYVPTKVSDKTYVYDSETGDLKGYTKTEYDAEGNVTGTKNYDPDGNELPEGVTLNLIEEEQPVVEEEVIEENQFAEEEPTEPEQPTEEVKPTEPEQPTEEVKPTEPEQPAEEVKPTEPEQPTEEVKPTEPEQPTEEVKPTEPEQPTEEVKPTEPEKPTEEVKPTAPETPAETETKTEDKAPAESTPSTPASAGDSGSASTPAAPAASAPASSAPAAPAASAPSSAPAAEG